ncbi:ATP-binding protein [Streptomyces sp. NBC_01233]|uniref:ATP-binding protein n=1 Tax=Streptomyces sp. NBC_01233 TaxID=2903787 RepID=UPI002E13A94D|nr:ATP-binding protein [Streptomyces sp. NBC_01233]
MTAKRNRGLTEQAADTAVDQACRMLRLPTIRSQYPELAEAALRDQMTYRGFLAELLLSECDDRARRRSERRIKAAGFPREKSIRQFDFDANPVIDAAAIHTLAKCDWVKKGLPLCLIGDSGTGKSHLLIALGTEAAMHDRLTFGGNIIETGTDSYRLAATRARAEQMAAAADASY